MIPNIQHQNKYNPNTAKTIPGNPKNTLAKKVPVEKKQKKIVHSKYSYLHRTNF